MNQHFLLKRYIEAIEKGYSNSLVVVSEAGYGKTETTLMTLKELGLQEGKDYIFQSNYITPVEFFLLLQNNSDKIIVLDDVEETIKDPKVIGILKGGLWSVLRQPRVVNWLSGTWKIKEKSFEFKGRIIFLVNQFNNKSPIMKALKDRGLYLELNFTKQELLELMKERIKTDYFNIPFQVKNNIIDTISKVGVENKISLRTLPKCVQMYQLSPNTYQSLIVSLLQEKL